MAESMMCGNTSTMTLSMSIGGIGWAIALHWASSNDHVDIAELLLDHGADIDAVTAVNSTPLIEALINNSRLSALWTMINYLFGVKL